MGVDRPPEVYRQIKLLLDIDVMEPIFIFRAQDQRAPAVIVAYLHSLGEDAGAEIRERVTRMLNEFREWQADNPEKVKVPD